MVTSIGTTLPVKSGWRAWFNFIILSVVIFGLVYSLFIANLAFADKKSMRPISFWFSKISTSNFSTKRDNLSRILLISFSSLSSKSFSWLFNSTIAAGSTNKVLPDEDLSWIIPPITDFLLVFTGTT